MTTTKGILLYLVRVLLLFYFKLAFVSYWFLMDISNTIF